METKFNFKSQVCTDKNQSERLLSLGLKKETADMCYSFDSVITQPFIPSDIFKCIVYTDTENKNTIPAWSLHRLLELAYGNWKEDIVPIYLGNSYDMLIGRIEFQVKQGKFNKEYLV